MAAGNSLAGLVRQVHSRDGGEAADGELLARYARGGDEAAFTALVKRHGSLVLGVARRQLAGAQVDDVFQATFLALARAAGRLGSRPTLTNWLYTVALRQARKARARAARRETAEHSAPPPGEGSDPLDEITGRELLQAIDDELARLPDRFRLPVLLCSVQGLFREEAAARLGWSEGAVKGRLERGRRRLAERLTARGLAPSAVLLTPVASVIVPSDLLARTIALAMSPWAESVPPTVASLAATGPSRLVWMSLAIAGCALVTGLVVWAAATGQDNALALHQPAANAQPTARGESTDDPLPEGSELRFGTDRFRHGTTIQNLSISADGKIAVAGSGTRRFGSIRVYDLATGRVLVTLAEQHEYVVAVALSPDGKLIAVKRGDHAVHFYDAATGRVAGQISYPTANPSSMTEWVSFSPDGKRVLVGTATGDGIHLIDRDKIDVVRTFKHDKVVFAAAFSPDGQLVAAGGYDSEKNSYFARLWDANTGAELRRFKFGNGGIRCLEFSPDGKTLAIGGDGGSPLGLKLFEVATARELTRIVYPDASRVSSAAFSPDGKTLAASGGSSTRLFEVATGKEKLKIDRKAIGLRFAPDGATLVGAVSGTIYRWEVNGGKPATPESTDGAVGQIAVTADGRRLITRGQDGDAHVWDAITGEHLRRVSVSWQRGLALSPDGRFLVWPVAEEKIKYKSPALPNAIHTGNRLAMLDLTTGQPVERFDGFEGDAHDLFFTADGKTLITVDHGDGTVRLWDVTGGKVGRSFRAVREAEKGLWHHVWHARLSPDGKVLAVTYQPAGRGIFSPFALRLWDTASGNELHDLIGHHSYVETMDFSPDGKYLVTGGEALGKFAHEQLKLPPDQVFVWDVQTGKPIARLPKGGTAAAFATDGKMLSVATGSGGIQMWETTTWKLRGEFRGHRDRVTALAPGPGGKLFSGSVDTTVLMWDIRAVKPPADSPR